MRELDLHGHTTDEALHLFVDFYNRQAQAGSREPFRVIHGYGSSGEGGKIRRKFRASVEASAISLDWKPGEDLEGNPGVTIVYPRKALPSTIDRLAASILIFCSTPRTESKLASEFRSHSAREIKEAIRALVRQTRVKEVLKGGRTHYVNAADSDKANS